jgi:hypothetical protein
MVRALPGPKANLSDQPIAEHIDAGTVHGAPRMYLIAPIQVRLAETVGHPS